ncbi:hypothetical protein BDF14DRAFT_1953763 [Spinellus fusiger]|nr:hypothetical protein BDF14DRAFT_1953763 [Spinellus fusiger]
MPKKHYAKSPGMHNGHVTSLFGLFMSLAPSKTSPLMPLDSKATHTPLMPDTTSTLMAHPRPNPPKKQFLNKFATLPTDKCPQNLCRDLLLSNFDRNLTVEKAHFEPQPLAMSAVPQPSTSTSSHSSLLDHDKTVETGEHKHRTRLPLNSSSPPPSLLHMPLPPQLSPPKSTHSTVQQTPANSTPLYTPNTPTSERRRGSNPKEPERYRAPASFSKRKKRSMATLGGTASPAEVFHRNLVDAVSNVEDSDENEQYVYPYSGSEMTTHLSNQPYSFYSDNGSLHRAHSIQSLSGNADMPERRKGIFGDLFKPPAVNEPRVDEEAGDYRPRLRNHVIDYPYRSKRDYGKNSRGQQGEDRHTSRRSRKHYTPSSQGPSYGDGYTSDDEGAPLLRIGRPRSRSKKGWLQHTVLGVMFLCVFFFMILLYRAKPLENTQVEMGRVLASDKELIFDLHVKTLNWNWWTVKIAEADISMFGFSQIVPLSLNTTDKDGHTAGADPAEYLGSFYRFDEPLSIPSTYFSKRNTVSISQIRIKSPGADKSGSERWSRIIRYSYGLVARGVFRYHPIPFPGTYLQSIAICDVVQVDPMTGSVSEDPDQSYCMSN